MTDSPDPVDAFSLLSARPDDTAQVRMLRASVIGMGVVLVLGFAAVVGRIFYLMTRAEPSALASGQNGGQPGEPFQGEFAAQIPVGAKVRQQSVSGSALSLLYEGPGGDGIIVLDLKSGRQISHIRFQTTAK